LALIGGHSGAISRSTACTMTASSAIYSCIRQHPSALVHTSASGAKQIGFFFLPFLRRLFQCTSARPLKRASIQTDAFRTPATSSKTAA
jgi:hypothetical protein